MVVALAVKKSKLSKDCTCGVRIWLQVLLNAGVAMCKCCRIQVLLTDMEMLAPNVNFTAKTLRDRWTNADSVDVFVGEMPCCAHDRQTSVGFLLFVCCFLLEGMLCT